MIERHKVDEVEIEVSNNLTKYYTTEINVWSLNEKIERLRKLLLKQGRELLDKDNEIKRLRLEIVQNKSPEIENNNQELIDEINELKSKSYETQSLREKIILLVKEIESRDFRINSLNEEIIKFRELENIENAFKNHLIKFHLNGREDLIQKDLEYLQDLVEFNSPVRGKNGL
jgi:hypothetical protein